MKGHNRRKSPSNRETSQVETGDVEVQILVDQIVEVEFLTKYEVLKVFYSMF